MWNLIKISWRNIWRNKLRSIAVIVAVMIGVVAGVFSAALVSGMMKNRFENFIEGQISHIQVHHSDFIRQSEVNQLVDTTFDNLEYVRSWESVKSATARSMVNSMIASATYTGGVTLTGIFPEFENQTTQITENLIDGTFLEESVNQILIGKKLADKLKVEIGSRIVLTFQDKDFEIVSAAFRVKGIFETHYAKYDESTAFVHINYLNQMLKIGDGYHELAILTQDYNDLARYLPLLSETFEGKTVRTWNQISPELEYLLEVGNMFAYIFIVVIMIGLAFGLLNTMLMSVFERTREIGMLMAIGMNKTKVFGLILLETFALAITGTLLGLLVGRILIATTSKNGIDLGMLDDVMKELGFQTVIYPVKDDAFFIAIPFIVIITALLAAIYPALKALKLNPAEAVRK